MTHALDGARLIGYKDDLIAVWYGGYGFNVYTDDWDEVSNFSSGDLAGEVDNPVNVATERMKQSGYTVVEA